MSDTAPATTSNTDEPQGTEGGGAENESTETPTVEELLAKVEEITRESRKWEGRAKDNFEAKKELDKIRREGMTEAERVQADLVDANTRADEAEARAKAAEAALARYKIVAEFGLSAEDAETLSAIEDETTLRSLAERLAGRSSRVKPNPAQARQTEEKPSSKATFVEALGELFN